MDGKHMYSIIDGQFSLSVSNTWRIVIIGKTGAGKSSLGNTIFGKKCFNSGHTFNSETTECKAETRSVNGRSITLIDTPGFFDTDRSEEELKREIVRCIIECAPGPHAFLIVLKVERFTEHEQAVIKKIHEYFSKEVFRYTVVLFTHGDQLEEGKKIEEMVHQHKFLRDLVEKCGSRNNRFQVEELLKSIDKMTEANKGSCYTNETLQKVENKIQQEEELIRQSSGNKSDGKFREQAKASVFKKILLKAAGIGITSLIGALFGMAMRSFIE
uniref:AIG1-type G domain-containing protein n=1 Tax=Dicentrarchus labrax TaxID=13489 RepID=A0A8C4DXS0_DICLA